MQNQIIKRGVMPLLFLFCLVPIVFGGLFSDSTYIISKNNLSDETTNASNFWDDLDTPADILISELNNDAGFITDGNTNWDNNYGFITDGNTNWDNIYGFIIDGNTNWDNNYGFITVDTNTNAGTLCDDGEYLDGDGTCKFIESAYWNITGNISAESVNVPSQIDQSPIYMSDYLDFQPFGYNRFYVYDGSEFTTENTRMPFNGSFTSIKNWNARIKAVSSNFFFLEGDNYNFRIYNAGYTFVIIIEESGGTDLYVYTNTSETYFGTAKTALVQFIAVNYETGEIRMTNSDGDIFTFDSVELKSALELIKNETWTSVGLGINSYGSPCKWSGIVKGVWDYDEKNQFMFDGGMNVPGGGLFAYKTGLLTDTTQNYFKVSGSANYFVDGSVTLDYSDIGSLPTGTNTYTWFMGTTGTELDNELPGMNNYVQFKYRIKVNSGEFNWSGTTTSSLVRWFAKDRDTGTEILLYNVGTSPTQTLPVGDWDITQINYLADRYGSSKGIFGFSYQGLSVDGNITIYDQLEIENAGLVSWANPRQCTYEKCYDSFARQFTTTLKVSLGEE